MSEALFKVSRPCAVGQKDIPIGDYSLGSV